MSKQLDFAPISREPSTRLTLVTGYFTATGVLSGVALGVMLVVGPVLIPGFFAAILSHPLRVVTGIATCLGLLWTARELRERRAAGWYSALFTAVASVTPALAGKDISWESFLLSTIGIALVVSVRDELD